VRKVSSRKQKLETLNFESLASNASHEKTNSSLKQKCKIYKDMEI
jgi:hypothetical protein